MTITPALYPIVRRDAIRGLLHTGGREFKLMVLSPLPSRPRPTMPSHPLQALCAKTAGWPTGSDKKLRHNFLALTTSVRGQKMGAAIGTDFGRHHALGAGPEADENGLAGPQLRYAVAPQRLHVHEDIRRPLAEGQETESP